MSWVNRALKVVGHLGFGLVAVLQTAVVASPDNGVNLFELRVVVGELFAGMAATAFARSRAHLATMVEQTSMDWRSSTKCQPGL